MVTLSFCSLLAGDHVMDPPQTVYSKRVAYTTFDVLAMLKPGHNAVGAMLGNYKWGCVRPD